jgi:hypothetical protein
MNESPKTGDGMEADRGKRKVPLQGSGDGVAADSEAVTELVAAVAFLEVHAA